MPGIHRGGHDSSMNINVTQRPPVYQFKAVSRWRAHWSCFRRCRDCALVCPSRPANGQWLKGCREIDVVQEQLANSQYVDETRARSPSNGRIRSTRPRASAAWAEPQHMSDPPSDY
jgi:hypothetical protein